VADAPLTTWRAEQICAHRGASAHYPENTVIAFDAAAHSGAGWIETDVQLLSDGELLVFHDETLGRTATGSAPISSLTWSDVASLDIGSWKDQRFSSERPMTCMQLIQWQLDEQDRPGIIWEAKCPSDEVAATATAAALAERISAYSTHRCIVSSFDRTFLQAMRTLLPQQPLALIAEVLPSDWLGFCEQYDIAGVHLDGEQLDEGTAQSVIERHRQLRCYTINTISLAQKLVQMGVGMVMTDRPDDFAVNGERR
jgi:glycerophosphoryl diester phosphodiesterase